jgi:phosphopantothenate synthetase
MFSARKERRAQCPLSHNINHAQAQQIEEMNRKMDEFVASQKEMYEKSFKHIKEFVKSNQAFFCKDIKEVLKEKDALLKKIKENEEKS